MQIWRNDNVHVESEYSNYFLTISISTQMQEYLITCKYEEMIMFMLEGDYSNCFLTISISTQMQVYLLTCKCEEMKMLMLKVILQIINFHTLPRTPIPYKLNLYNRLIPPFQCTPWIAIFFSHEKNQRGLSPTIELKPWIWRKKNVFLEEPRQVTNNFYPILCTHILIEDWLALTSCLSIMSLTFSMSLLSFNT